MVKKREFCMADKEKIVKLFEKRLSYGKIDKKLCFKRSTVQNLVKRWQKTGIVANVLRSGRACLISPRLKSALFRNFLKDKKVSAPELASKLKIASKYH